MKLRWSDNALRDLEDLGDYVANFNPNAADRIVSAIFQQTDSLTQFPSKGRVGRVSGTRELIIAGTKFIVAYRLRPDQIEILAVLHTSRRWPEAFA